MLYEPLFELLAHRIVHKASSRWSTEGGLAIARDRWQWITKTIIVTSGVTKGNILCSPLKLSRAIRSARY